MKKLLVVVVLSLVSLLMFGCQNSSNVFDFVLDEL